jgi:hypothetical protein
MSKMIAYCGLDCSACPAFLATQADDPQKRAETAQSWSKQFHVEIKPEEINCDGCHSSSGRLFTHPQVCEIRKCGLEKRIPHCAHCPEYACEKLTALFGMAPEAKEELDKIHREL